jgi:hypothetical protein
MTVQQESCAAEQTSLSHGDPVAGELTDADLETVVAGKEGSGRKLLSAMWESSGFNPRNNEWWRTSYPINV